MPATCADFGRTAEALARAEGIDPADADIPYARALILLRLKRSDEARAALRRVLDLRPWDQGAAELMRQIP